MQHKHQSKSGAKATKATPEDAAREQLIRATQQWWQKKLN